MFVLKIATTVAVLFPTEHLQLEAVQKFHAMLKMLQEIVLINLVMRQRLSCKLGKLRRHN
jgi:hypothetical protein